MYKTSGRRVLATFLARPAQDAEALRPPVGLALLSAHPDPLLALASAELILPALYPRLVARNLISPLPEDLATALFAVTELNRERNSFILSDALSVISLLNGVGIDPIPLKGVAYLLAGVYDDPAERFLSDLDLLIPESQFPSALAALSDAGYNPLYCEIDPIVDLRHHAPPMVRQGHMPVELHRSIGLGLPSRILPSSEIIASSQLFTVPGHPNLRVRLPSPEHLVIHLIVHSQIWHDYSGRIWPPLRALDDLVHLARHFPNIDWPSIENHFRSCGQLATFKLHLLQLKMHFGFTPPIPLPLTPLEKLRWTRRRLLNRWSTLRFFDPSYLFLDTFSRRFRTLRVVLRRPGRLRAVLQRVRTSLAFANSESQK